MYSLRLFFPQNCGFIILNLKSLFLIVWESTGLGMMIFWIRLLCWLLLTYVVVQENKFLKFLGFMWNPLSWVMEAAALMAIVLANGQVCLNL